MAQQQEYFLYLGRNQSTATHLHQVLVEVLYSQPLGAGPGETARTHSSNGNGYEIGSNGNGHHNAQAYSAATAHTSAPQPADAIAATPADVLTLPQAPQVPLPLQVVSNQKLALRFVQSNATRLVAVETSAKSASRRRFCESLRQRAPQAHIVAIGPYASNYSFAFDAVMATPLRLDDMMAVAALVRAQNPEPVITRGPVTLNTLTRQVSSSQGVSAMTPKQCALLTLLMRHANSVVGRADIMRTIWDTSYMEDTRTLDVHVRWLRMMIEPDPAQPTLIVTKRGVGYQFVAADEG